MEHASVALGSHTTPSIDSPVLGTLTVRGEETIHFPEGVLGFPEARRFVLIPTRRKACYWLQSLDHGPLVFLLVDPFEYVDDFSVELSATDLGPLPPREEELAVLTIVTLPRAQGEPATVNLQGPLVFNLTRRLGRQIVLSDSSKDVRRPIDFAEARLAG